MEDLLINISKNFSADVIGAILLILVLFGGLSVVKFAYKVMNDRNSNLSKVIEELIKSVSENTLAIRQLEGELSQLKGELKRMDAIFKKIPEIEANLAVHGVRLDNLEKKEK